MKNIYVWAIVVWFLFAILAVINATFREKFYRPLIGELYSHQLSTVIFVVLILAVMYLFFHHSGLYYYNIDLWIIGFGWLAGTIVFEFVFGHYVFNNSWQKLLADYNIFQGRVWIFVLIFTFIGPWFMAKK